MKAEGEMVSRATLEKAIKIGEEHAEKELELARTLFRMRGAIYKAIRLAKHGKIDDAVKELERARRL